MIYLDSNVFIYAILDTGEKGKRSRQLIDAVRNGKEKAATASLTFDEVVWKVKRARGLESGLFAGKAILELPLVLLDVNGTTLWQAYGLIERLQLDPRDAIHAACAQLHGISTFVSDDTDFDKVPELKRKGV